MSQPKLQPKPSLESVHGTTRPPRRLFLLRLLLGLMLLVGAGSGCSRTEPSADLTIVNGKEPESLDPAVFTGQPDGRIGTALFEGLTRYNAQDGTAEPGLAERWTLSPDGRTYTFHIRSNAAWSTGAAITARDLEASWLHILHPLTACDYAGLLFYIEGAERYATGRVQSASMVGIKALSPDRFEVRLRNPTPFFPEICALPNFAVLPLEFMKRHGDRWLNHSPVPTSGAYELEYWRLNDKVRLRRNPRYWDAANTRSAIVDLLPVSNPSTALNLYATGKADVIWDKDLVPTELIETLRKRHDFHRFDYLASYFMRFNTTRKPFDDPRVRRAFVLALDRPRVVSRVTRGGEQAPGTLVPPGMKGYQSPEALAHDPERARQLLAEAGYPGGKGFPRISYLYNTGRDHEKIGVELRDAWKRELGVEVELRSLEWKVFFRAQTEFEYDLCRSSWVGDYNDPSTFLDLFISSNPNNRTGWRHAGYDRLMDQAGAEADPARRMALLREAESILITQEPPIMPLYTYVGFNFWDPDRIEGIYNNLRDEHPLRVIRRMPATERAAHPERGSGPDPALRAQAAAAASTPTP